MKPKVIVYKKIDPTVLTVLQDACDVVYFEDLDSLAYPSFLQELLDAQGILGSGLRVDEDLLVQAPRLKIVSNTSVGYDNLDIPALTRRGIMATNTPGVLNDTVADAIFGLLMATARRMPELHQYVKSGQWDAQIGENRFGVDVHHKVLGIIGMGGIGSAIAQRAHCGFGMEILYYNRTRNLQAEQTYHATYRTLDNLLQQSDFVCTMLPLTPQTNSMIGLREFKLMKHTAIFINGARGSVVDEEALIYALKTGEILAAGLDVFVREPIEKDNPLLTMNNVVTLPHIGSATEETRRQMAMLAVQNMMAGLAGKIPPCLINQPKEL